MVESFIKANVSQALCEYMDKSRQGVVPRTCLSKLPLKPRPNGPPPPGMGPMRSQSPSQNDLSMPPPPAHRELFPAPLSPSFNNMNAPGPMAPPWIPDINGRQRSYSNVQQGDAMAGPHMGPNGVYGRPAGFNSHRRSASMGQMVANPGMIPSRKPVPGEAM